jgi:hypothetical protein
MTMVVDVAVPASAEQTDDLQVVGGALREVNALSEEAVLLGLALVLLLKVKVIGPWRVVMPVERTGPPVEPPAAAVHGVTVLVDVEVVNSYCIAAA